MDCRQPPESPVEKLDMRFRIHRWENVTPNQDELGDQRNRNVEIRNPKMGGKSHMGRSMEGDPENGVAENGSGKLFR